MACEYVCDGCKKKEPAEVVKCSYFKPEKWFQRSDLDGIQDACSRECIEIISKETGKTNVVLSIRLPD